MEVAKHLAVVPLNDGNYATWKIQMKMHLLKDDLFGIVEGTETAPGEDAGETIQRKYKQRREKALATIVLSVEPKLLYLLGDPTDPQVVWSKLSSIFQKKSWSNKLRLRKRL